MKYNAFISYRHTELDMEIAKKLHKGLETFHIPKSVQKKYGKKRIERVFRDQEELPIGSDLDDNITKALTNSEYLLVICSPRTPESYWVCKEIDSFISLHDREHVLAVLIEGEPAESFPPQLLNDENGNPVEPLAADVRGATPAERNKKFKTELMRLVSPLIGCNYDELRQRHKERIMRRNMAIIGGCAGTVAVLGLAFGLYNATVARQRKMLADSNARLAEDKTRLAEESANLAAEKAQLADDILLQYQETQKNQSRFYAEKSLKLLDEGKREAAALIAMEGLPDESNDRPFVAECEYALSRALHVYDNGNQLDYDRILKHDQPVSDMKLNFDQKYLISVDYSNNIYLWDPESWELIVKIPFYLHSRKTSDTAVAVEADDEYIYMAMDSGLCILDHEGNEVSFTESDGYTTYAFIDCSEHMAFLVSNNRVACIDTTAGDIINTVENDGDETFGSKCVYVGDGILLVSHSSETDVKNHLTVISAKKGKLRDITLADEAVLKLAASSDGHVAVMTCNADFYYSEDGVKRIRLEWIDPHEGSLWKTNTKITVENAVTFITHMKIQEYEADGRDVCRIVISLDDKVYEWDAGTGEEQTRFTVSNDVQTLLLAQSSDYGIVAYSDGVMDWIDTKGGRRLDFQRVESRLPLRDLLFYGDKRLIRCAGGSDLYLLSYHTGTGLETLPELENKQLPMTTDPDGQYYVTEDSSDYSVYYYYDKDGNLLYCFDQNNAGSKSRAFYNGKHVIATMDGLWSVDPLTKNAEYAEYKDFGTDDIFIYSAFSDNGRYCALWLSDEYTVIDLETRTVLCSQECDGDIDYIKITENGEKAIIVYDKNRLCVTDLNTGISTPIEADGLWEVSTGYGQDALFLNHAQTKAAMFCSDGFVRIADLSTCKVSTEIPLQSNQPGFADFTADDSCLLLQADDQPVCIWDIEVGDYRNLVSVDSEILYTLTDKEHGHLVCICRDGAYVFTDTDYTLIAFVPDTYAYFGQDEAFIQCNGLNVYRSHYMDCNALLAEAGDQLHEKTLTGKEKREYNIE